MERRRGVLLFAAGTLTVAAACVDSANNGPTNDAGVCATGCTDAKVADGTVEVDTSIPDTAVPPADVAVEDAAVDASADAPIDTNKPDAVIVGCVPQEVSTRYDATWIFGSGCRADWNASNQVTFSTTLVDGGGILFTGFEGTIVAANAITGALFATSDGIDLFNGSGVKTNTAPLGGNSSTSQAVAFVGKPGSASDFYIVTNAASSQSTATAGLFYSELPCGQLVPAGPPTLLTGTDQYTEALATVRHANDVDRWLLSAATTGIAVIPLTAGGFGAPAVTPWGSALSNVMAMQRAFIAFARDRHTFAITVENQGVVLGQFDNATGTITGLTKLPLPVFSYLYSAAFSADGTKLYVSSYSGMYYQVDLGLLAEAEDAGDGGAAVTPVGNAGGAVRLAIDDKLYIAAYGASALGVVNNPNAPAAQLQLTTAPLPASCTSSYGFPGVGDL